MAQLIQMRQRIKAIETIKKITHAMRLISMSMHSRLRAKAPTLAEYQKEVTTMFQKVKLAAPQWKNSVMFPEAASESNPLIVLVASQKGLCGNFNSALFRAFTQWYPEEKIKTQRLSPLANTRLILLTSSQRTKSSKPLITFLLLVFL